MRRQINSSLPEEDIIELKDACKVCGESQYQFIGTATKNRIKEVLKVGNERKETVRTDIGENRQVNTRSGEVDDDDIDT